MQLYYPQPARESLAGPCPLGQPFPIEGPKPPVEHREQRRGGPMPQSPEELRSRLPGRKSADHAAHESVEVVPELRAGPREQTVGVGPRDGDETENPEQLLQVCAPALRKIGSLDPTHPAK